VRSATNFKGLPDWEGLFAMGGFCPLKPMFAHQREHKAAGVIDFCTVNLAIFIVTFAARSFL
ncbi:hypothetical protein ACE1B4_14985, partial [Aeromonas veronii]|uniref:hypothetical protein n=1 Tax=Aeromonas veronii TaxID=654 RepID=UPI0035BB1ADE